jgi:hypothetical protein
VSWSALQHWTALVGFLALAPVALAAISVPLAPKLRNAMPGGGMRLFLAGLVIMYILVAGSSMSLATLRAFPRLYADPDSYLLEFLLMWFFAGLVLWAAMRYSPASRLLSDFLMARRSIRRRKQFGRA